VVDGVFEEPNYRAEVACEFFAPAGTPADRIQRIFQAMQKSLAQPATRAALQKLSAVPDLKSPAELAKLIEQDVANAKQVFDSLPKK
jgi:tripartite-type tricarboxylate transporter receptor subunit TctC